jgi:hypothetical protein
VNGKRWSPVDVVDERTLMTTTTTTTTTAPTPFKPSIKRKRGYLNDEHYNASFLFNDNDVPDPTRCIVPGEEQMLLDEDVSYEDDGEGGIKPKNACAICLERKSVCTIIPCKHTVLCIACGHGMRVRRHPRCPECKKTCAFVFV